MFAGRKTIKLSELKESMPPALYHDAKDFIKSFEVTALKVSKNQYRFSGYNFQTLITVTLGELREWSCNCVDYMKTQQCVHVGVGALLIQEQVVRAQAVKKRTKRLFESDMRIIEHRHLRFLLKSYASKDNQLAELTSIIAMLTESRQTEDNQAFRMLLESAFDLNNLARSTRGLQRQLQSCQILMDFVQSELTELSISRIWDLTHCMIPYTLKLSQRLQSQRSKNLVADWHETVQYIRSQNMAPEFRERFFSEIKELCREDHYDYLREHNLFKQLYLEGESQIDLIPAILEVRHRRSFLLQDWFLFLEFVHGAEGSLKEYPEILHQMPAKIILLEAIEDSRFDILRLMIHTSEQEHSLTSLLREVIIENYSQMSRMPSIKKLIDNMDWIKRFRNGDLSVTGMEETEANYMSQILNVQIWQQSRDYAEISAFLRKQHEIKVLRHLDRSAWNHPEIRQVIDDLLDRYVQTHLGLIPIQTIHGLLRSLSARDMDDIAMHLKADLSEKYPDRFS